MCIWHTSELFGHCDGALSQNMSACVFKVIKEHVSQRKSVSHCSVSVFGQQCSSNITEEEDNGVKTHSTCWDCFIVGFGLFTCWPKTDAGNQLPGHATALKVYWLVSFLWANCDECLISSYQSKKGVCLKVIKLNLVKYMTDINWYHKIHYSHKTTESVLAVDVLQWIE